MKQIKAFALIVTASLVTVALFHDRSEATHKASETVPVMWGYATADTPKASVSGLELIREYEGLRLVAYKCSAGVWTIGYGHTKGVKEGDTITEAQAEALLREDYHKARRAVVRAVGDKVSPDQIEVLTSLTYNIGQRAFNESTLVKRIHAYDIEGAAQEILKWRYDKGQEIQGLINRRKKEYKLFTMTMN